MSQLHITVHIKLYTLFALITMHPNFMLASVFLPYDGMDWAMP